LAAISWLEKECQVNDPEQRVRERAYQIWTEEGRPEGRADVHWDMARELIAIEDNAQPATPGEPVEEASAVVTGKMPNQG
jgi:Protein of unknown function (DUF2934)